MKETYNLPVIARNQINDKLKSFINSSFETSIRIPTDKIVIWKEQFK